MTFLRPDIHTIRETPVARLFQRKLKCPDVFTFFNFETRQWILAYWINKNTRILDEVEDLGPNFELVTPELVQQIVGCWGAIDWKAKKKRLISNYNDRTRKQEDELMDSQDKYTWLQKRMGEPVPYVFRVPVSGR